MNRTASHLRGRWTERIAVRILSISFLLLLGKQLICTASHVASDLQFFRRREWKTTDIFENSPTIKFLRCGSQWRLHLDTQ